jgi:hypothetical protein
VRGELNPTADIFIKPWSRDLVTLGSSWARGRKEDKTARETGDRDPGESTII